MTGATDLVGTTVGSIRIVEELGRGGMGRIFAGFDERLQRRVAVKAIDLARLHDRSARSWFLREARILSALEHLNVCRV